MKLITEEDQHEIVRGYLSEAAHKFNAAAASLGVQGISIREDGMTFIVSAVGPEAFEQEYGKPGEQPGGWVGKAISQMGGQLS